MTDIDPLFVLLRRYQAERKAFDDAPRDRWNDRRRLGQNCPGYLVAYTGPDNSIGTPATTAAGGLLALDHVLQSDDLFFDRSESSDLQMLWLLVKAARDYIALVDIRDRNNFSKAG